MEYAWSADNPDRWDPERTGVLNGRQHHTLDMELFGPNSWLTSLYVVALEAAAEMADTLADAAFAEECRAIAAKGRDYLDRALFNGEYFQQAVAPNDRSVLDPFDNGRTCGVCLWKPLSTPIGHLSTASSNIRWRAAA